MTQGQSAYTWFKEERFAPVFTQSLRISKAAGVARFAYYHVDLNAGSGFNDRAHVSGSPLNFLGAVEREQRTNFYAFFVDHDLSRVRDLVRRPSVEAHARRVNTFHADNAEILPTVAEFIADRERNPHLAVGSIVFDPNGYHKGVPWIALRDFCAVHSKFDLICNLNLLSFWRERAHILARHRGWETYRLQPISEFRTWFNRPCWMWTDICSFGGHQWVQCVGRTMRTTTAGYPKLGFYDSESERGRAILQKIEQAAPRNPQLPFLPDV